MVVPKKKYKKYRDIYVYKSIDELMTYVDEEKCITCVSVTHYVSEQTSVGVIVQSQGGINFVPIKFLDSHGTFQINNWLVPIEFSHDNIYQYNHLNSLIEVVDDYMLLIPAEEENSANTVYSVISKSWKIRDHYGNFSFPNLLIQLYNQ